METRSEIIQQNIDKIQKRIVQSAKRCGRLEKDIVLLAVTKNVALEDIRAAIQAGIRVVGENKIQDAKTKFFQIGPIVQWHFIGHLQTNKTRPAAAIFDMVESIDSKKLADSLDLEAKRLDREIQVLIEVNIGEEDTKFGVPPAKTEELVRYVAGKKNLRLRGLMSMAPYMPEPENSRPFFRVLSKMFREFRAIAGEKWNVLSMGMTNDFEVAIEEGATLIRIGTGIFHTPNLRRRS